MSADFDTLGFAHLLADAAGGIARHYFRTAVPVETKHDQSPVSLADREIEKALRARIAETFPDHGILGEEMGSADIERDYVWVIDPIDGTRAFLAGRPLFTTLIALCFQGTPILGIIDQPIIGERYVGAAGQATTRNKAPISVRSCERLTHASLATTSPAYFAADERGRFEALRDACGDVIYGGDAYNYAQLASGFIDIVAESGLKPYDVMALRPIIEGAGGIVTTWNGAPLTLYDYHSVVAGGSARIHVDALSVLAG